MTEEIVKEMLSASCNKLWKFTKHCIVCVKHQLNYIHIIPGPKASEDQTCEHPTKLENSLANLHIHALHIAWTEAETVLKITVGRL